MRRSLEITPNTISIGCCGWKISSAELKHQLEESQAEWCLKHVNYLPGRPKAVRFCSNFPGSSVYSSWCLFKGLRAP